MMQRRTVVRLFWRRRHRVYIVSFWVGLLLSLLLTAVLMVSGLWTPASLAQGLKVQESTVQPESLETAWVVVDGQRLFEIAEIEGIPAQQRAGAINSGLTDLIKSREILDVNVGNPPSGYGATIYNGTGRNRQQILSITANDLRIGQTDDTVLIGKEAKDALEERADAWAVEIDHWVARARRERRGNYFLQASLVSLAVLLSALGMHYLLGNLWWRYVLPLIPVTTTPPQPGTTGIGRTQFSFARFSAQLLLMVLRLTFWLGALWFVVRQFRLTRSWSNRVQDAFEGKSLPLGETSLSVAQILALLVCLGGLVLVAKIATNVLRTRLLHTSGLSLGMQAAITILLRYAILFVGIIVLLQLWGIDLSSLTLLASALGVGLGLGLQNIAKDISSGLVLVFERPIQVGDFIELNGQMGMVDRIGPRSTDIRTLDQISIIVPNSRFLEHDVINWSHRNPLSRIHIPVGVAYGSHPETVKAILLEVGREHAQVMAAPAPEVFLTGFGESSMDFELLVWIRKPQMFPQIRSDLNFAIATAFRKLGIEIPFPQRDIHLPQQALPVTLSDDSLHKLAQYQRLDPKQ